MKTAFVICPDCLDKKEIDHVLTAQSNQNVIYKCQNCGFQRVNIETKKG